MNVRSFASKVRPRAKLIPTEGLGAQIRTFKRDFRNLSSTIWKRIMMPFTHCFVISVALEEIMPYQRLKRSRSELSDSLEVEMREGSASGAGAFVPIPQLLHSQSLERKEIVIDEIEDTVVLKVGILGDSETGKTSFVTKYVSAEECDEYVQTTGVSSTEKVFRIQNAKISLRIWDLGGHWQCSNMLPLVCQDASAILLMFDLTRRSTLHSVKGWFLQARQWNANAIPVIIGSKYDHFVQMPQDIQLAIIRQARFYAHAMGASLFFSSVTHNINIHKIFKVIVAKLFDVPCNISRNLNFGEPIIDY